MGESSTNFGKTDSHFDEIKPFRGVKKIARVAPQNASFATGV
jgi:hypothetical protein